jgi:RecQ family ATP-dependent DNA helicase
MPRSLGGKDEPANLVTLCPGCHGAKHPLLQASLSRRYLERWSWRLAKLFDSSLPKDITQGDLLGSALRLFGTNRFRNRQLDVVLAALSGKSLLYISPTGSGKSLCFQLPSVLQSRVSFVFVPLKALMSDQVISLQRKKIPSTFINSDLSKNEKEKRFKLAENNVIRLLYIAPEQLDNAVANPKNVSRLGAIKPHFMVIDEAHCVDKWGNDFRPSYSKLAQVRNLLGNPPILAFTATATSSTQARILESIGAQDASIFLQDIDRPAIAIARTFAGDEFAKIASIKKILKSHKSGKLMIFVPTIKIGQFIVDQLKNCKLDIPFYNSKITSLEKSRIFEGFLGINKPEIDAVICTNAFGMGLDVANVRMVVHWQPPSNLEDYLQEMGRAARDGAQSVAILFVSEADRALHEKMIDHTIQEAITSGHIDRSDAGRLKRIKLTALDTVTAFANSQGNCLRKRLLSQFGTSNKFFNMHISAWIIRLVFGKREKPRRFQYCCSECAKRYRRTCTEVDWALEVLGWKPPHTNPEHTPPHRDPL